MGHHISAVILRGPFDAARAAEFDLRPTRLTKEHTFFPLDPRYTDHWAENPGISGGITAVPLLNSKVIHRILHALAPEPRFAVIETDYAGGTGSQAAVVYHGDREVMAAGAHADRTRQTLPRPD